ncbi:MAG: hypothetical protein WC197_09905 [Candidatus Gastranaerophilaceae bacterium]|jgi:hypothetical protein
MKKEDLTKIVKEEYKYIKNLLEEKRKIEEELKDVKDESLSNSTSLANKKSMPKRLKDKFLKKEELDETTIGIGLAPKHLADKRKELDELKTLRKSIKKQLYESYKITE